MRKALEVLMDLTLLLVFILISSNYIETLPRYTVEPKETKTVLVKNPDKNLDNTANQQITPSEKSNLLMK
ncbi:MAG TPA: hypothetical protein VIK10_06170 [Prolixibacteraceae bacterium]